jgi:uncharacterized membrane protein
VFQVVLGLMNLGAVGLLLSVVGLVVGVAGLAALILMMVKANGGEEFLLPVIGEMAKKWA